MKDFIKKGGLFFVIGLFMTSIVSASLLGGDKTIILAQPSSGGGSSNPFDQSLNTTDEVRFVKINSTDAFFKDSLIIGNDTRTTGTPFILEGNYTGNIVSSTIDIRPKFYGSGSYAIAYGRPQIKSQSRAFMFYYVPAFSGVTTKESTSFYNQFPAKTVGINEDYTLMSHTGDTTSFFNFGTTDATTVDYNWVELGKSRSIGSSGGTSPNVTETMIKLTGGGNRVFGTTGFLRQTGIEFTGFGTKATGTNDYTRAIYADGGDFIFTGGSYINASNVEAQKLVHTGGLPNTGSNAGSSVCIDANGVFCACGSCA